jgi:dTDP-4-amino-4,6-dideoxygalactose transaminase
MHPEDKKQLITCRTFQISRSSSRSRFAERRHVWHQFVVRSQERDRLRDELSKAQIGTGLHYPILYTFSRFIAISAIRPAIFPSLR